jgi:probable F420-dependent oxidoreductase
MAPGLGVSLANYPAAEILALARRADELGFDSVWLADHVLTPAMRESVHPYPAQGRGKVIEEVNEFFSATGMAAAITASTARIEVAIGVLIVPLRHPLLIARDLVTISELAPGRIVLGAGAGWMWEEFEALEVPFKQRISRLEESIEVIREVAAGGAVEHDGRRFRFAPITLTNRPAEIPIILGGTSDPAIERAALLGDGWYSPGGVEVEDALLYRERIYAIRSEAIAGAVAAETFRYVVRVNPFDPESADAYRAAGFEELVLDGEHVFKGLGSADLDRKLDALERAAADFAVAPAGTA